MHAVLPLALSLQLARRLVELGLFLGLIGSLLVATGALFVLRSKYSSTDLARQLERSATLVGFALIGVAFLLQLIAELARVLR